MNNIRVYQNEIADNGFTIIDHIFSVEEVDQMIAIIDQTDSSNQTFRKSADLFAIRQFLKEVPEIIGVIFNDRFCDMISELFGKDYFVVKSIYFDKPEQSNWFVSYHQDLTISVNKKADLEHYGNWTVKHNQFAVQPPLEVLENIYTVRIHLDDTDEENGALKVVPQSHLKDIYRATDIDWTKEQEVSCNVIKGGVMIMKPLLLHSSGRTTNNHKRRVVHIEFSDQELPEELDWSERMEIR